MKNILKKVMMTGLFLLSLLGLSIQCEAAIFTTIGDSINVGWVGPSQYVTPYGTYTAKKLGMDFVLSGRAGNMFYPNSNYGDNYFAKLIETYKSNLQKASFIVIMEGTNDYGRHNPLNEVKSRMKRDVQHIKNLNPDAKIFGILPMNRWDHGLTSGGYITKNRAGYTLQTLLNEEKKIYESLNIPTFTFSQIGFNLTPSKTVDNLHPTASSHKEMGYDLGTKLNPYLFGKFISHNKYYKISKKGYGIFKDKAFKNKVTTSDKLYNRTYYVKGYYNLYNGRRYYSLYNTKKEWVGYINANAMTPAKNTGSITKKSAYVTYQKTNYKLWNDLNFLSYRGITTHSMNNVYRTNGYYTHYNGSKYYSIYNNRNEWKGYINDKGIKVQNHQFGNYVSNYKKILITRKNYGVYQDKNFQKKVTTTTKLYNKSYIARGYYNLYDGTRYYTLYNGSQWLGYVRSIATKDL